MKRILTSFALAAVGLSFAQVGVNAGDTGLPDIADDAVFQVSNKPNEFKGVLLPSVSLKSKDDKATTSNGSNTVTTGLMVWNDGESALKPAGYYYWDGANWILTGNVEKNSTSTVVPVTNIGGNYTLKPTDTLLTCKGGANVKITVPPAAYVKGRNFVVLNDDCSGGMVLIDEQGTNILAGGSVNTGLQEGLGFHLYYDGNRWFNTTAY